MSAPRRLRAIRGATTADADDPAHIAEATAELVREVVGRNGLSGNDLVSAFFTVTPDLRSDFPARTAREMGWADVPLLCTMEIPVEGALEHCIRLLVHVETTLERHEIRHVYLRGARALRPDIVD